MVSARAAKEARRRAALKKSTPSSIDRLEPEVRELISQLRVDKGFTIDEIRAALVKMIGEERAPSRSALGRHVRELAEISAEMRDSRIYADALAKEAGGKEDQQLVDMNIHLLHLSMFKLMLAAREGEGLVLDPQSTKYMSESVKNLQQAQNAREDSAIKREKRAAEKATREASEKAVSAARAKGLSKDTVEAIRRAVLGSEA